MAEPARPYRGPEDAIRIGLPATPLNDMYFWMMRGRWWHIIGAFIGFYLLANVGFAALYSLDTQALAPGGERGFGDAFFFSVQTISTIGYGTISPQSRYANLLVTAESMVGLLGVAMATGLIFAKFSRVRARVRFSKSVIVTRRNKKPCLMLRVANERGNEVVEASMRVSVLMDDISEEGHRLRRVLDLELVRSTSPIFSLSWLVMHEIDERSPIYGLTPEKARDERLLVIVTLMGIDGTFAETVHARNMYTYEDIAWGRRFVDVIDYVGERVRIDYTKFDDTEADPSWTEPRAKTT
jgi:inward rectifier potassium channel